jgi:hypothetical protein
MDQEVRNEQQDLEYWIRKLNGRHAVVKARGGTYVIDEHAVNGDGTRTIDLLKFQAFREYYSNLIIQETEERVMRGQTVTQTRDVQVAREWLKHPDRRTYEGLIFNPRWTQEEADERGLYNMWRGLAVEPKKGDCSLFWKHLLEVICDNDHEKYTYIRKWMAHAVQKPWELPKVAIAINGSQGTGKGSFSTYFSQLFDPCHSLTVDNMDKLTGRFNGHLKEKIVITANEATWGGNKKEEGVLKALITDEDIEIEMKGMETFTFRNFARLIVTSNNAWFIPLGQDDRRYVVCTCSTKYKGDFKYFEEFHAQMQGEGKSALLYDLQHEDIEGWNPLDRPKSTDKATLLLKIETMEPHEQFYFWWLQEQKAKKLADDKKMVGCKALSYTEFYSQYRDWANDLSKKRILSNVAFSMRVFGEDKLIPTYGKRKVLGETIHVIPNWKELYDHYCKNVIYMDLGWEDEKEVETVLTKAEIKKLDTKRKVSGGND